MIRQVLPSQEKERIASEILSGLPEWFGLPESTADYIRQCRESPFWAAFAEDSAVGFIALRETSPHTAEILVMGVRKEYHHTGLGRKLFAALREYAESQGYTYIQVKTVAAGHYPEYDRTRLFYEALGFLSVEVFPTLWDPWNPCLLMIRPAARLSCDLF